MRRLLAWLQQPTTVGGLSGIAGTVAALATRQITPEQAIPFVAGSLVSVLLPDNCAARQAAERLARQIESETVSPK